MDQELGCIQWANEVTRAQRASRQPADTAVSRKSSVKRQVPNNRRVSSKRQGFEACVLSAWVLIKRRVGNKHPGLLEIELSEYQPYTSYIIVLTQIIS